MPGVELHGRASFEWAYGGAFLIVRAEIDHPEFPAGIEIFGSDDQAGTFYMLHFDERGISRKYDVSITDSQLKWWREDDHFSQRFTMAISKDKLVSTGEMSRDGGDIKVHGSGNLAQTLFKNDLVDELHLMTFPITLGTGKRLFAEGTIAAAFEMTDSLVAPNGVIFANYKRAGDVQTGTVGE
jgi:hypothetical protein